MDRRDRCCRSALSRRGDELLSTVALFAFLTFSLMFAVPARGQVPEDLRVGTRVSVEGRMLAPKTVEAGEIEIESKPGGHDELKGVIQTVEPEARTLTVMGVKIAASSATWIEGADLQPDPFSALRPGQRVAAKGTFGQDGIFVPDRLKTRKPRPGRASDVKFEGRIQEVDPAGKTFVLLGVTVKVTPQTRIRRD